VSEQGLRKALYQKIVAAFPEGWMSSGQVSREGELHVRRRSLAAR
jgi:Ubinuclein conserved middle domain